MTTIKTTIERSTLDNSRKAAAVINRDGSTDIAEGESQFACLLTGREEENQPVTFADQHSCRVKHGIVRSNVEHANGNRTITVDVYSEDIYSDPRMTPPRTRRRPAWIA